MPTINLLDPSLNKNNEEKELSVQISMNSFSFCINTLRDKNVIAFRSYHYKDALLFEDILNQTESILEQDPLLKLPFTRTKLLYISRKSTLVPDEFFEPELSKRYIEFNQPIDDLDELHYNSIYRIKSKLVFAIPTYLAATITESFKKIEFINQAMPLIDILGGLSNRNEGFHVLVNLNKEFFDIVITKNGKLLLYNSFLYVNSNDLAYFILFVCKQLDIDCSTSHFYVVGECSNKPELIKGLSGFIKNIQKPQILQDLYQTIKIKDELLLQYATLFKLV
jgi:hypothetical protein